MRISQLFICNSSGDIIVHKIYRNDIDGDVREKLKEKISAIRDGTLPPHFEMGGIFCYYIRRSELLLFALSNIPVAPIAALNFLIRLCQIIKDFCGDLAERTIKANLFLILEILDEVMNQGYQQVLDSDKLRSYIQSEAEIPKQPGSFVEDFAARLLGTSEAPSSPISKRRVFSKMSCKQNEIFVDVIERVTATIDTKGIAKRLEVSGEINLQSFISEGYQVQIALNDNVVWEKTTQKDAGYGSHISFTQFSFHPNVKQKDVEKCNIIDILAPPGEVTVMNYHVIGDMRLILPFHITSSTNRNEATNDVELRVTIVNQFPGDSCAINVVIEISVSGGTDDVSHHLSSRDHTSEFINSRSVIRWFVKEFPGNTQAWATFRLMSHSGKKVSRMAGLIALEFEISGRSMSGLSIRYLKIIRNPDSAKPPPQRWIRYVTASDSYVCKI